MEEIATVTESEAKNCLQKTPTKKVLGRKRSLLQDFLTLSLNNSSHLNAATRDRQQEEECQMSSPSPPPNPIRRRNKRCRRLMFFATGSTTPPSSTAPAAARPLVLFASEGNAL